MKKLSIVAACVVAFSGCAEMPSEGNSSQQTTEKRFQDDEDFVTGSRIARKAPKTAAPAGGGASTTANSANR